MASVNTESMRDIDQSQRDLITGYFRQIEQEINIEENPNYNATQIIVSITILYYYIRGFFTICRQSMKIIDGRDITNSTK